MPVQRDSSLGQMNSTGNPYLALGLVRNPFVAADEPGVPDWLWVDRGWSEPPPLQAKQFVQFIGPKGAGKTSHLKHWQARTGGAYCYYPPGWGRWQWPAVEAIAYWDEADRVPWPLLALALAKASLVRATIVAGTHADLGRIASLLGLTVRTIHLSSLDGPTLQLWATYCIEAVRVPHLDRGLHLTEQHAAAIAASAQGSWRKAGDRLHIWAAQTASTRHTSRFERAFPATTARTESPNRKKLIQ